MYRCIYLYAVIHDEYNVVAFPSIHFTAASPQPSVEKLTRLRVVPGGVGCGGHVGEDEYYYYHHYNIIFDHHDDAFVRLYGGSSIIISIIIIILCTIIMILL